MRAGLGRFEDPKARTGYVGLIPHDFRRSAVRNLERSGVPRSIAMELVGHVTESIYRSYAITDETSLREGVAKLEERFGERPAPTRKVAPLDR